MDLVVPHRIKMMHAGPRCPSAFAGGARRESGSLAWSVILSLKASALAVVPCGRHVHNRDWLMASFKLGL